MKTNSKKTSNFKKGLITLGLSFIFFTSVNAQDILTLKNGSELNVKIVELNDTEIKYKKLDNLEGPVRVIPKIEVFSIKYENGSKDVFGDVPKISEKPTEINYYSKSPEIKTIFSPAPVATPAIYEPDSSDFAKIKRKKFDGPRVGITYISPGTTADYLASENKQPLVSQFGWQFEGRLFTVDGNTQGIVEFVPLIGGIEQGLFIPSASFLIGVRTGEKRPYEFAVGPNFSVNKDYNKDLVLQPGVVIAFGTSFKSGNINFPVNIALIPSVGSKHNVKDPVTETWSTKNFQTGWRLSFVVGFNSRKK